jgi:chromosome segregation ATPase
MGDGDVRAAQAWGRWAWVVDIPVALIGAGIGAVAAWVAAMLNYKFGRRAKQLDRAVEQRDKEEAERVTIRIAAEEARRAENEREEDARWKRRQAEMDKWDEEQKEVRHQLRDDLTVARQELEVTRRDLGRVRNQLTEAQGEILHLKEDAHKQAVELETAKEEIGRLDVRLRDCEKKWYELQAQQAQTDEGGQRGY